MIYATENGNRTRKPAITDNLCDYYARPAVPALIVQFNREYIQL